MTCFNEASWVEQALESVTTQSVREIQLIVTDDCSTDDTCVRVERWLARNRRRAELIFSDRHIGLPAMLNRTLPLLTGDYVVVLNADDWMESDRLEVQAGALDEAGPAVGVVYSDVRVVNSVGVPTGGVFPDEYFLPRSPRFGIRNVSPARPISSEDVDGTEDGRLLRHLVMQPAFGMCMAMFRRDALDVIGPWDESLEADDYDFQLRLAAAGFGFLYLPHVVANYRRREGSMTSRPSAGLAKARFGALIKVLGRDRETDQAAFRALVSPVMFLHSTRWDRAETRQYLLFLLKHAPSPRVARALAENVLLLPPGVMSVRNWKHFARRFRKHIPLAPGSTDDAGDPGGNAQVPPSID